MNTAARIESLPGYVPTDSLDTICARLEITPDQVAKLDSNENPYGPSPCAAAALAELASPHYYPDAESRLLREALARFTGAPVETLLAGSGADELIDLMVRVVLDPGDRVITCPPTFEMYAFDTRLNHGEVVEIPRRADFSLDLPAIAAAVQREKPKILFIASPNNPDGSLTPPGEIDALLDLPVLVVLDEAYIEFTDGGGRLGEGLSRIQQVAARENLAVLRTFSKWAGLAGLRVGYGAFPEWLAAGMWTAKQPYNVNAAASAAALATLGDLSTMAARVALLRAERERLFVELGAIPYLKPYPSQANFILCAVQGKNAGEIQARLLERGVLVRAYRSPSLPNHLRIAAGRPQDTTRLVRALKEIA